MSKQDVVGDDEHVGLHEDQLPHESLQAQVARIGFGRIARDLVDGGRGDRSEHPGSGLDGKGLAAVEPLGPFAELSVSVDQQRVVLPGPLGMITVVAHEPLAAAEEHEMVGVGVYVPAARIIGELRRWRRGR